MTTPLTQFTRLIDEAFNAGDLAVLDDLVSPDFVEHQFESPHHPARAVGPAGVARVVSELRAGADDFHRPGLLLTVAGSRRVPPLPWSSSCRRVPGQRHESAPECPVSALRVPPSARSAP